MMFYKKSLFCHLALFLSLSLLSSHPARVSAGESDDEFGSSSSLSAAPSSSFSSSSSSLSSSSSRKRQRTAQSRQVYGIATYDVLFKYVLSGKDIASSFLRAFVPDLQIVYVQRLGADLNPVQNLQHLRNFLSATKTGMVVDTREIAAPFIEDVIENLDNFRAAFPKESCNGTVDFVCLLAGGGFAMVEMQAISNRNWGKRALAHAANLCAHQILTGKKCRNLKKVIAINVLGESHERQICGTERFIGRIEFLQYSIINAANQVRTPEEKDWITFFRRSSKMSEDDVQKEIETPAVLKAFELAKMASWPEDVLRYYEAQEKEFSQYSKHTESVVQEAVQERDKEIALKMLEDGESIAKIIRFTGLAEEVIEQLRPSESPQ